MLAGLALAVKNIAFKFLILKKIQMHFYKFNMIKKNLENLIIFNKNKVK